MYAVSVQSRKVVSRRLESFMLQMTPELMVSIAKCDSKVPCESSNPELLPISPKRTTTYLSTTTHDNVVNRSHVVPISKTSIICLSWKLVSRHGLGQLLSVTVCIRRSIIVLLDPCNIAARRPLRHADEASPNLAALFVFLDSEQRTVVARGEACIEIPKRV